MAGKIISCFCCLLCAGAFFLIPLGFASDSTPINFWSGDTTLKEKIRDIPAYNREMRRLYRAYGASFLLTGAGCLFAPALALALGIFNCTAGIFLLYRGYKAALRRHS